MKSISLLFVVACAAGQPHVRTFSPMDKAAILAVLDAQVAAWNRGDLAGYMAGYARSDALVFTSGGNVRRGWQTTFDAYHEKYAQNPVAMGTLRFEVLDVQALGADGAIVLGRWFLTGSPADGHGVFSVALERQHGTGTEPVWRVIHDHTSLSSPP